MSGKTQIQAALQKPYDSKLFGKEVLRPVFGSCFTLSSTVVPASVQPNDSEIAVIESVSIYGNINLEDGTKIICYEIKLQPSVRIEHSKVTIQRYVRKLLMSGQIALVNFIAPQNNKVWRLTLVAKDSELTEQGIREMTTHAKRYTYLLGPSETCKTAAERFETLSTERQITFRSLVTAFSVEKLSTAFFDEYTLHYQKFCNYLQESSFRKSAFKISIPPNPTKEEKDKACKPIRDFVKKLLGRIVFLYFVQKKGWLGASDINYNDGLTNFVKQLFIQSGGNDAFYSNWLAVLFFETLNKERTDDDFKMPGGKKVKVPFLNGGLFDKEEYDEAILTIPAKLFHNADFEDTILTDRNWDNSRGFLDFLDAFNFTVYEDSPDDHTVAVDPEMLGHIFENLLEDNKDKGTFYTPKEIVHYMCQESLTVYLLTHLSKKYTVYKEIGNEHVELLGNEPRKEQLQLVKELGDKALNRDDVAYIVKHKDISHLTKAQLKKIGQLLDMVKICDPAIGSGAFPMGLLQEIHTIYEVIAFELEEEWKPADVKENIIQHSIYGVDIEKGAVDIARLRFWLSLVVDEEKPRALPNLDYKIVTGDSLLSKFEGETIEIDWEIKTGTQSNLFGNENVLKRKKLLEAITQKQKEYFHTDMKKKLTDEIRDLKIDILINQLELMISTKGLLSKPNAGNKRFREQNELWLQTQGWKKAISKLENLKKNKEKPFEHFDWKLDFPDVLNPYLVNGNGGFDIVIGNPPYLNFKMYSSEDKEDYKQLYKDIFDGKADVYYYFFYKANELGKEKSITSIITSRYWIEAEYAKKLRKFISSKTTLKEIIDFKNVTVFDGIGIKTGITSFLNKGNNLEYFFYRYHPGKKIDYIELDEYVSIQIPSENISTKDSWNLTDHESSAILKLIEKNTIALEDIANCKQGIVTGLDKAFITTSDEFKKLPNKIIKPWLKVGDIHKYSIKPVEKREIVYTKLIESIDEYPELKQRLLQYKTKLSNRREAKNGKIRWFDLQWPREQELFESEKLICRFKASENTFCYDNHGFYSSADTTVVALNKIGKGRIKTKYLLALLNSKVLSFYFKSYGKLMDYRYEYYPGPVGRLRIKEYDNQIPLVNIADYILFLKQKEDNELYVKSMSSYFERVIDAAVYELYFPESIISAGCEVLKYLNELHSINPENEIESLKIIRQAYNSLTATNHPIDSALLKLNNVPEVQIIEGK